MIDWKHNLSCRANALGTASWHCVTHTANVIHQKEYKIKSHYSNLGKRLLLCVGEAPLVITDIRNKDTFDALTVCPGLHILVLRSFCPNSRGNFFATATEYSGYNSLLSDASLSHLQYQLGGKSRKWPNCSHCSDKEMIRFSWGAIVWLRGFL
jgi:hypothetical protein